MLLREIRTKMTGDAQDNIRLQRLSGEIRPVTFSQHTLPSSSTVASSAVCCYLLDTTFFADASEALRTECVVFGFASFLVPASRSGQHNS